MAGWMDVLLIGFYCFGSYFGFANALSLVNCYDLVSLINICVVALHSFELQCSMSGCNFCSNIYIVFIVR